VNQTSFRAVLTVLTVALLLPAGAARADSLDGRWCTFDGRRMSIEGPEVTVPGRGSMIGEYVRGALVYGMPGPEPGSMSRVFLTELDQERLEVATSGTAAKREIWHRCGPPIA